MFVDFQIRIIVALVLVFLTIRQKKGIKNCIRNANRVELVTA